MSTIKRNAWKFDDDFAALEKALAKGAAGIVDVTAREVKAEARNNAPVDTSALKQSGHVRSPLRDEYPSARAAVKAANSQVEVDSAFDISGYAEEDVALAVVDFMVLYASLVHDGHYNMFAQRHLAGRPFLANAVRNHKDEFEARIAALLHSLGAVAVK